MKNNCVAILILVDNPLQQLLISFLATFKNVAILILVDNPLQFEEIFSNEKEELSRNHYFSG